MTDMDLTYEQRLGRLDTMIAEGRLLRGEWQDTGKDGRERACLLAALSPEAGAHKDPDYCPASVMPAWLARLTPPIDDHVSKEAWPGIIRRYATLAHRWHVLTNEQWRRLDYRCRAIAVREALTHAPTGEHVPAAEAVLSLLDRAATGEVVSDSEFVAAADAASKAASDAASWAASKAADAASRAASWAAAAADEEEAAADAAADAAAAKAASKAADAAWDRMATAMLDAIEMEIGRAT